MNQMNKPNDRFVELVRQLWSAEKMLTKSMPLMIEKAQHLGLKKNIAVHHCRILAKIIDTAIPESPFGRSGGKLTHETILHFESEVGKLLIIINGAETLGEVSVLIITGAQNSVTYLERISEILAILKTGNLRPPPLKVLPVEETHPFATIGVITFF